jgi:DNA-directed RNA polymerase subunit RPC12/RpoP
MKIKTICTHCGKKQTAQEKNYSLNYVKCKYCGKEGTLTPLKLFTFKG